MQCRVCDSPNLCPVIDLGKQPKALHFLSEKERGKEPLYPLTVVYCEQCKTAQLDFTVKKEEMYSDHTYLSGVTKSLAHHFDEIAKEVDSRFFLDRKQKKILDIGSNDGTQLKSYQKLGWQVVGVEAAKTIAKIANEGGVPTLHAFFNLETAKEIASPVDAVNASGVFFHLEELHSVTEGIRFLLKEDGVFVVQFLYMKSIMENGAFDQIYHEHLLYYTLETIDRLLNRHGLALFDAYLSPIHGGSIMGFVGHLGKRAPSERLLALKAQEDNSKEAYLAFAKRIGRIKEVNLAYLHQKKREGKTVFGMGAPVKGNTLLNYFGVGTDLIPYLVEKNPLRKGLYSPGAHIPIILEQEMSSAPDAYYVLAWNFKEEILRNNKELLQKGVEFYFPVEPVCK